MDIKARLTENEIADIKSAVDILRKGGVVLYPTDTVWGIGCDARSESGVARIYDIKKRQSTKAMITLVDSIGMLERVVANVPEPAYSLIEYSEKPLTIIYDKAINVAPNLIAEDGSIAVRVTRNLFAATICRFLKAPLVSTSANISGAPTPLCFSDIPTDIIDAVDYVCLSHRTEIPAVKPSTIIQLHDNGVFKLIRQ